MASLLQNTQPASSTVYARNLEERIKIADLKEALTEIFAEYGSIVDIVAKTNLKAKGQAFIVFESPDSAAKAIEEVNGFELFDKPMQLDFARTRSDATVLRDEGESGLEKWKRSRLAEKERKQAQEAMSQKLKRPAGQQTQDGGLASRPAKTQKGAGLKGSSANASAVIPDEYLPPNKTLFIRELPESYDQDGLTRIFSRFDGFKEVRMVPGRKGIAFVEYDAEAGAISAKEATAGMQLGDTGSGIRVTFQRA
jgi:U2 small nuclear ribonucleoprotein B''